MSEEISFSDGVEGSVKSAKGSWTSFAGTVETRGYCWSVMHDRDVEDLRWTYFQLPERE